MKTLLNDKETQELRNSFSDNAIFAIFPRLFKSYERELNSLALTPEEVFVNCMHLLDNIRKNRVSNIEDIYDNLFCDIRKAANELKRPYQDSEIQTASLIILLAIVVCCIENDNSSFCMLAYSILEFIRDKDCSFFETGVTKILKKFNDNTGVRTFEAAAYLRKYGIDIIKIKKWFQSDLESYNVIADIVKKAEIINESIGISEYEEKKTFASVNYYLNFRYYFENYDYSKFVVKYFLASSKIDLLDICEEIGINETIFNICLTVVKELDPCLYQEYENKVYQNKLKRYEITKRKIEILYERINDAKENNTEFSKFEFLINMPFAKKEKSRQSFFELKQVNPNIKTIPLTIYGKILEFAQAEMPEMVSTLKEYMMENGLYRIPEFTKKELKKTYFLDSYTIINEQGENVTLIKENIQLTSRKVCEYRRLQSSCTQCFPNFSV